MMTHDEMSHIIQMHKLGHKIEWQFINRTNNTWYNYQDTSRGWRFDSCNYRVKEPLLNINEQLEEIKANCIHNIERIAKIQKDLNDSLSET